MSGWQRPAPPPEDPSPRSYWTRSSESDALGPRQLIGKAWRLYRSAPRRFLLVAVVPELVRDLLAMPGLVFAALTIQNLFQVMGDLFARIAANPDAYRYPNSQLLQTELEGRLQAGMLQYADWSFWSGIAGAIGFSVALFGASVVTAAALQAASDQPISVSGAFRLVVARGLLKPIIGVGLVWVIASAAIAAAQSSVEFQTWAGVSGSPRSMLLASLLTVTALVAFVATVILAARWALFLQVVLAEGLSIRSGLTRAARLTHGIRIRLSLAFIGIGILQGLLGSLIALVVALATGLAFGSVLAGIAAYLVVALIANLLWAPMVPAMLTVAYRDRIGADRTAPQGVTPTPEPLSGER